MTLPATAPSDTPPTLAPLAVDARTAAAMLSLGLRTFRGHDGAGKIPAAVRIAGKKIWLVSERQDWLRAGAPDRKAWEIRRTAWNK